ncbi:MAG: phage protease [Verrucomicrobiota bacterium]
MTTTEKPIPITTETLTPTTTENPNPATASNPIPTTRLGLAHGFHLPDDGWVHIAPLGRFDHPSGVVQVLDAAALESIAAAFRAEAGAENFPGLLVDFDHFSHDGSKPSEAAGWISALDARPDGLWARVRWSDAGEAAVRGGRYRLVSPVWNGAEGVFWTEDKATLFRPGRLDRVALTNDPNLTGLVPLTNRQQPAPDANPIPPNPMNYRNELLRLLELPAEAGDEEIAAALAELTERLRQLDSLETETAELREDALEADLEEFADVIADPAAVREQLIANRAGTRRLLAALRRAPRRRPLHNRGAARIPAGVPNSTEAETRRARRIANRARQLQRELRVGHTVAFNLARGEILHG